MSAQGGKTAPFTDGYNDYLRGIKVGDKACRYKTSDRDYPRYLSGRVSAQNDKRREAERAAKEAQA